jgi:hypothetical protein
MSESEFPIAVLDLIRRGVPTFPAVEFLIFLQDLPNESWTVEELVEKLRQRSVNAAFITEQLARFRRTGLVEQQDDGRFRFSPATPELAEAVKQLKTAFNERPVTLIRAVYAMADHPIQSFADSFRIKGD